jgi:hypothetical protein
MIQPLGPLIHTHRIGNALSLFKNQSLTFLESIAMPKRRNKSSKSRLWPQFWTAGRIPTLDALRGHMVTADLLCMAVIGDRDSLKQVGLAYLPVDASLAPNLHPLDSFQARNSVSVYEANRRIGSAVVAKVSAKSVGGISDEMIPSDDVPQAVLASNYAASHT